MNTYSKEYHRSILFNKLPFQWLKQLLTGPLSLFRFFLLFDMTTPLLFNTSLNKNSSEATPLLSPSQTLVEGRDERSSGSRIEKSIPVNSCIEIPSSSSSFPIPQVVMPQEANGGKVGGFYEDYVYGDELESLLEMFPLESVEKLKLLLVSAEGDIELVMQMLEETTEKVPDRMFSLKNSPRKKRKIVVSSEIGETPFTRHKISPIVIDETPGLFEDEDAMFKAPVSRVKKFVPTKRKKLTRREFHSDSEGVEEELSESSEAFSSGSESEEDIIAPELQQPLLQLVNSQDSTQLMECLNCSLKQADMIRSARPFYSFAAFLEWLGKTKGISDRLITNYEKSVERLQGIDEIISKCTSISDTLSKEFAEIQDIIENDKENKSIMGLTKAQPDFVPDALQIKKYQIVGINWLLMLHRHNLGGILADEMGLGKTAQTIVFLGLLKQQERNGESNGPFLIVVPSSTIENWKREFEKWCPILNVELYNGTQAERMHRQDEIRNTSFDVILTTYSLLSAKDDRKFLKSLKFQYMILDEGHMVKNMNSQRYKNLTYIKAKRRLLLTGTVVQNNLQELISLLVFIMPSLFSENEDDIVKMFSNKFNQENELMKIRIDRARTMMKPFVLRRQKFNVLKDLPGKSHHIIQCDLTAQQAKVYSSVVESSKKWCHSVKDVENENANSDNAPKGNVSNILMELRKAACHPLLIRYIYDDAKLKKMARQILKEEQYFDANEKYVFEDMQVMSDAELHNLCLKNPSISSYALSDEQLLECGKVKYLVEELLPKCKENGDRILMFSQFTMMLDLLEIILEQQGYSYLRMDGQTDVDDRQQLIDAYQEDSDYFVFLLSTKAGNLLFQFSECTNF